MENYKNIKDFFNSPIKKEIDDYVDINLAISEQVMKYLHDKRLTQKDLAQKLGKRESEISKWLSGTHNLTLKSISKISAILNEQIIVTPLQAKEKYKEIKYVTLKVMAGTNTNKKISSNYQENREISRKPFLFHNTQKKVS